MVDIGGHFLMGLRGGCWFHHWLKGHILNVKWTLPQCLTEDDDGDTYVEVTRMAMMTTATITRAIDVLHWRYYRDNKYNEDEDEGDEDVYDNDNEGDIKNEMRKMKMNTMKMTHNWDA